MKNLIKSNQNSILDLIKNGFEGKDGSKRSSYRQVASYDSMLNTSMCAQHRTLWLGRILKPTLRDIDVIPESEDNQKEIALNG